VRGLRRLRLLRTARAPHPSLSPAGRGRRKSACFFHEWRVGCGRCGKRSPDERSDIGVRLSNHNPACRYGSMAGYGPSFVIAGLVPAISIPVALALPNHSG